MGPRVGPCAPGQVGKGINEDVHDLLRQPCDIGRAAPARSRRAHNEEIPLRIIERPHAQGQPETAKTPSPWAVAALSVPTRLW